MSRIFTLSEASSIAIHSMVMIARSKYRISVKHITKATDTSEHHVAKVMQKLVKAGYVSSSRGPGGGFVLSEKPENITLLNIYEKIEGKITIGKCQLDKKICPFDKCIMEGKLNDMTMDFKKYLSKQKLADYIKT